MKTKQWLGLFMVLSVILGIFVWAAEDERVVALKNIYKMFEKLPPSDLQKRDLASYDKEKEPLFKEISSYIDYDYVTFQAFPENLRKEFWKNKATQEEFQAILKELIEEVVYPAAKKFIKKVKITFHPKTEKKDDRYLAKTTVLIKGDKEAEEEDEEMIVEYFLKQKGSQWAIQDIIFDEEGWMPMFRDEFNSFMQKNENNYTKLIEEMKNKLAKAKRGEGIFDDVEKKPASSKD